MTLFDLLLTSCDVDVFNNVTDSAYPALVCPVYLTSRAREHFAAILPLSVDLCDGGAVVNLPDDWKPAARLLRELTTCAAGYCAESVYNSYFFEPDDKYYRVVNNGEVITTADVYRGWLRDPDAEETFPEEIEKLTTPWVEALREIPQELKLDGELESFLLKLVTQAQPYELDVMQKLIDTADGVSWEDYFKLDDQLALRRYILAH